MERYVQFNFSLEQQVLMKVLQVEMQSRDWMIFSGWFQNLFIKLSTKMSIILKFIFYGSNLNSSIHLNIPKTFYCNCFTGVNVHMQPTLQTLLYTQLLFNVHWWIYTNITCSINFPILFFWELESLCNINLKFLLLKTIHNTQNLFKIYRHLRINRTIYKLHINEDI